MFYLFIFIMNLINSTYLLFISHPMAMGLVLLIQTLLICLISGISLKTFWFSYILFLIFLGGLLVLFIYLTSLASNEMFKFSNIFLIPIIFSMFSFFIMIMFSDKLFLFMNTLNLEILSFDYMKIYFNENALILNKLFMIPIYIFTVLLMIYLFLTLIAIVKITNIFEGPLRPKF